MKQTNLKAWVERFFKDKQGKWAIIHFPNILLSAWIVLLVINLFIHYEPITQLQSAVLFAWAYMELTEGRSYFRKLLGAIFVIVVVVGFFV